MRGTLAIARRELAGLFLGPLAWTLLFLALLLTGWMFVVYLKGVAGDVDFAVRLALGGWWIYWALLVTLPPLLTMRMISEEARSGLLEFLLTAPVTDAAVVTGKFLAALAFMTLLWSAAFAYALVLASLGLAPDAGQLIGGWIGALLCSGLFCAIGLLASALTATPIVAAFTALVLNLALVSAPHFAGLSESPGLRRLAARIDLIDHHRSVFLLGVIDSAYAAFFVAWTLAALFLAVRALEARRWR